MFQQDFPQYDAAKHAWKRGPAYDTSIMNHNENPV